MAKVLVVGASRGIGLETVKAALLAGHSVRALARTPAEFASFGAAWKSDEAVGAVKIIPPDPTIKGIDVDTLPPTGAVVRQHGPALR
jgi:NAD(P)-dependent dehydrogenase (short-subunit alcohol dehydrogenase family)